VKDNPRHRSTVRHLKILLPILTTFSITVGMPGNVDALLVSETTFVASFAYTTRTFSGSQLPGRRERACNGSIGGHAAVFRPSKQWVEKRVYWCRNFLIVLLVELSGASHVTPPSFSKRN